MTIAFVVLTVIGVPLAPGGFLLGTLVVILNMLFYISLTVMLGAIFDKRGGVIAIPLAMLFGQQYLLNAVPALAEVLPWGLALPLGDGITTSIAASLMMGETPPTLIPVVTVAAAGVVLVVAAIWRFRHVEL
jgi:hypothetical protein